ncbi:MAG: carboxyl transferase domain-containing protein [Gammaproteobacteria bacterium]|nr:carboxyl transferase domain-containing protein [Gammaproteobacteria bacterium]
MRLFIANRGEIVMRIMMTLKRIGWSCALPYTQEDAQQTYLSYADQTLALVGEGASAYLDAPQLVSAAVLLGCKALHPGYGFLSENAALSQLCLDHGVLFIGAKPETLAICGDKQKAKILAHHCQIPILPTQVGACTLSSAGDLLVRYPQSGILLKALAGGGGRGIRRVSNLAELDNIWELCRLEALATTQSAELLAEVYLPSSRHIEVQIAGDGQDYLTLGERDCSLQRNYQKILEISPAPHLPESVRRHIYDASLKMAEALNLRGLATFEFLVSDSAWYFMEINPRLQVEHTISEEVWGVDLVEWQILLAQGCRLADLPNYSPSTPSVQAMQIRLQAETWLEDGRVVPHSGQVTHCQMPSGRGMRVDSALSTAYTHSTSFDSLLAKLIVQGQDLASTLRQARFALQQVAILGLTHNAESLARVLAHPKLELWQVDTEFLAQHWSEFALAPPTHPSLPSEGDYVVTAPMDAKIAALYIQVGDQLVANADLLVLEAMKMQHAIHVPSAVEILQVMLKVGDQVLLGSPLLKVRILAVPTQLDISTQTALPPPVDWQKYVARIQFLDDAQRPQAVAKRHAKGGRTARENLLDLCDAGTFIEYGALAYAAQTRRRTYADLIANTPADGMVCGLAEIQGIACMVLIYDYTVLAGTQGMRNHQKVDRMLDLALRLALPTILFAEGGGGRPGDVDAPVMAGLNVTTFQNFAKLAQRVPLIGVVHGYCFAGNAALLGICDIIVASQNSYSGMGGPAMIEGGGLGVFRPEQIGPVEVQTRNGVVDRVVKDEAQAVLLVKKLLPQLCQGSSSPFIEKPTPELFAEDLRHILPANRQRVYDMRNLIHQVLGAENVIELQAEYAPGMITALVNLAGVSCALVANNVHHLAGAIDATGAQKFVQFLRLAKKFDLPVLSFIDTPGFMVGPDVEKQGQVRLAGSMFSAAAELTTPWIALVIRKAYGLGAQAMAGGGFTVPLYIMSWPSGEFGAMGPEGAVKLGYKKELEATTHSVEREKLASAYLQDILAKGSALSMAESLEIDEVIDPADTKIKLRQILRVYQRSGQYLLQ